MLARFILFILLCILLNGCSHTTPKQYTLQSSYNGANCHCEGDQTLLVLPTQAAAELHTDDMLYSPRKNEIAAFAKHQWSASPAKLMTTLVTQAAQQSHQFSAVTVAPYAGIVDYRLSTRLIKLYQDFTRCPSHLVLQLDAALSDASNGKLVASKTFVVDVVAPSDTPYGGVIAANKASAILMQQLICFLNNTVR